MAVGEVTLRDYKWEVKPFEEVHEYALFSIQAGDIILVIAAAVQIAIEFQKFQPDTRSRCEWFIQYVRDGLTVAGYARLGDLIDPGSAPAKK